MTESFDAGVPVPDSALDSGSDAGTPGERPLGADPENTVALAAADDAPLPPGAPGTTEGGDQGDGLTPEFREG